MGAIIAFLQADGVLPTDMKDSKMMEGGRASALEMFLTTVEGKPSVPQVLLFFVLLIALSMCRACCWRAIQRRVKVLLPSV